MASFKTWGCADAGICLQSDSNCLSPHQIVKQKFLIFGDVLRSSENMLETIDLPLDSVCNSKIKENQEQSKCPLVEKCINTCDLLIIRVSVWIDLTEIMFG